MAPTVLLCMGTRPEIIKMAPVYRALAAGPIRPVVVHTGQHGEMAWELYRFFGMVPDHALALERERPTLGHLSARLLDGLDRVIAAEAADAVLVHGDTSSALAAAMAAFYAGVPVGHVEAGLRSGDLDDPFPEEMNRTLIGRIARWHFAPTPGAVGHLRDEGVAEHAIALVGNTVVDAVQYGLDALADRDAPPDGMPPDAEAWLDGADLALVTMHRRENWGAPIADVAQAVAETARDHPGLRFLWPVHPNPAVREAVERGIARGGGAGGRVRLTGPLSYPALLCALRRSWLVLTDSGGIQEEAAALDRPVLVLRQTTERPEVIEAGGGALIGPSGRSVRAWVQELAANDEAHAAFAGAANPYGDGLTGRRIADLMVRALGADRRSVARTGPWVPARALAPCVAVTPTPDAFPPPAPDEAPDAEAPAAGGDLLAPHLIPSAWPSAVRPTA